jgi:hypothetical protein
MAMTAPKSQSWADPAHGLATAMALQRLFVTLVSGAAIALGLAMTSWLLVASYPWLERSVAEALIFAASLCVMGVVMLGLLWVYMMRPLRKRMAAVGQLAPARLPPPAAPNWRLHLLFFIATLGVAAVMLWLEYVDREVLARGDLRPRLFFGRGINPYIYPSYAGLLGVVAVIHATFAARRVWGSRTGGHP